MRPGHCIQPYASVMTLAALTEYADTVFPIENAALLDICHRIQTQTTSSPSKTGASSGIESMTSKLRTTSIADTTTTMHHRTASITGRSHRSQTTAGTTIKEGGGKPFDEMNNIVAQLMLNLTRYFLSSQPCT